MEDLSVYIGAWRWHHTMLHILSLVTGILTAFQGLIYSFTLANPELRCMFDGESSNSTYSEVFGQNTTEWSRLYEGENQGGYTIYCKYCPDMIYNGSILPGQCGDNFTSMGCKSMIYDTSRYESTITKTYDLVCKNGAWKQELAKSLFMVGILLGAGAWGTLADRIGRRPTYLISSVLVIVVTNIFPLMPNFEMICVGQILIGFGNMGPHICIFTIVMEYTNSRSRSASGMIYEAYFSIGYLLTGLFAYLIRDWKILMWACSAPNVFYIVAYTGYIPESYTWLVSKGKVKEARKEIERLCRLDVLDIPKDIDKVLSEVRQLKLNIVNRKAITKAVEANKQKSQATVLDLLKNWNMAKNTLILVLTWFAVNMVYYGVSLNASDLPGDAFTNFELMGAVEIPAGLITIPFMNWMGRVPCLYGLMCIGGVALFISGFLANTLPWYAITTCALIGKMGISSAFSVLCNYTAEIYPTIVRTAAFGLCALFGRFGSIAAPQVHLLGVYSAAWVPLATYGALAFAAGFLDFFLPETMNKSMPQTMDDGIRLASKNYSNKKTPRSEKNELEISKF